MAGKSQVVVGGKIPQPRPTDTQPARGNAGGWTQGPKKTTVTEFIEETGRKIFNIVFWYHDP